MSESDTWIVAVSGDRPLADVAKDLAALGFQVGDVLDAVGCIIGSGSDEVAEAVQKVPGVAGISRDRPINFGSPE